MTNFDHVRLGRDAGTYIFSIENGREKTGHRSITIVLPEGDGEYMGIRTSGRERLSSIQKMPLLWEKSAVPSATDAVSANVTSELPNIDGRTNGSASNQSNGSDRKDTPEFSVVQGVGGESGAGEQYSLKDAKSVRDVVLETIPKLDESNKGDKNARVAAMKAIGGNLSKLRQAMGKQRAYDRETVIHHLGNREAFMF